MKCPSADCPEGVGVVVFVQDTKRGYRIQRCTATAIEADQILTNGHCGKDLAYNRAYFFTLANGQTKNVEVGERIFDREEGYGLESGMAADLAIFHLKQRLTAVHPRRLARKIPPNMQTLVAYMANDPNTKFQDFTIDKSTCSTVPHQVLFGGGSSENNVGLALFNCPVAHGNSGSPLFLPDNLEDIQVVVNSSYPFGTPKAQPFVRHLLAYFVQPPRFIHENFGMGNRVHCMDVEGQPKSEEVCSRMTFETSFRSHFESGTEKIARERLNQLNAESSSVLWGVRVFPIRVEHLGSAPAQGIALIPYPICVRSNSPSGLESQQPKTLVQYLSVGFDEHGNVIGKVQKAEPLRAHFVRSPVAGHYEISFLRDYHANISSSDLPEDSFYISESDDREARRLLAPETTLIGKCLAEDLARPSEEKLGVAPGL